VRVSHADAAADRRRSSTTPLADAKQRATFVVVLRAEPRCTDPIRALRQFLKLALRRCGLRALSVETRP
jgi:hypothetical protein